MLEKKKLKTILIIFMLIAFAGGFGYGASRIVRGADAAVSRGADAPIMVPGNFAELAEKVRDGVVNIQTVKNGKGGSRVFRQFFGNPFGRQNPFEDFFGPDFDGDNPSENFQQKSLGSGFIIDREGYILTNNHVVESADEIKVKLSNEKEFNAKVIGRDPKTDLALIKINGTSDLRPLRLGDSDALKVGNWVVAIGSPFGLEQTVTAGIVSAKGRTIGAGPYDDFIQTDASINPGNSGGPLINTNGEVIGINTAIVAAGQGIGFAIPVNMAKEIMPQLKDKGKVTRGWIGVSIQDITPELAKSFGLKERKGALVSQVVKDGPADKAGIQQGDVIIEFDRKVINESKDLPRIVASITVGKPVTVRILRNGNAMTKDLKVGEMEGEPVATAKASVPGKKLGINVQDITPELARSLSLRDTKGVVVTRVEPGSAAASAGIRQGDIIREIDRKSVRDSKSLIESVEAAQGNSVLLLIQRGDMTLYVPVTPR